MTGAAILPFELPGDLALFNLTAGRDTQVLTYKYLRRIYEIDSVLSQS